MKKRIFALAMTVLMVLTCVFTLASCMGGTTGGGQGGGGTAAVTPHEGSHKDTNCDGKCDLKNSDGKVCGKKATGDHTFEDDVCVNCGEVDPDHVCRDNSNPADGKCDLCDVVINAGSHTCADVTIKDHKCDECEKVLSVCVDNNDDGTCDICEEDMPVPQCPEGECTDADDSDGECDVCGYRIDCDHVDNNNDTMCDNCDAYVKPKEEDIDYPWDSATLIMQLTENTAGQEILSVSRKYLAGDPDAGSDMVSDEVRARNAQAMAKTGIRV
ncbi:MAG: hypothetical protein IKV16_00875, partial [Clostridia bacterium]|nr:hypothetical protein [Clostridia bacterium]